MKEGSVKAITDKFIKRQDGLRGKITQQLKVDKPFAKEKIPTETKLWAIDHLGTVDMEELRQEFGDAAINLALHKIEKMRNDGRRKR